MLAVFLAVTLYAQSDWRLAPRSAGYTSEVRREGCRSASCVDLTPPPAPTAPGILLRTLDAAPFRGRPIRLRASVRLDNPGPGDRAQLFIRVALPGGEPGFY